VSLRLIVKRAAQLVSLIIVFLPAALSGFGRITAIYLIGAHTMALIPGIIGNMLRAAWYRLTLIHCSQDVTISFGTFFSQQSASVARNVSIGSYCVIGSASIGEGTLISSSAQITSGVHDHPRDDQGHFLPGVSGAVRIGSYCLIGASTVVMADVGDRSTIAVGSIVLTEIPPDIVAAGNPARLVRGRPTAAR
jgi:acetyltransferase-like isoleucine patch superfamily enzyme